MPMKLIYFGSGAFGVPTLERLVAEHDVRLVVTQPDRPAGRGGKLTPTPVGEWCALHAPDLPVIKPEKVNQVEILQRIRDAGAEAFVVIAFGQKLGKSLLDGVFAINLHASLLPRWRGAAPINAAMLGGDAVTGNSVITLADRMDAGLILGHTTRAVGSDVTAGELHDLLSADGPPLVLDVLQRHVAGSLTPRAQDENLVTLAGKLSRADAWVDFSRPASECLRRVHGLTPWPGVMAVIVNAGSNGAAPLCELKLLRVQALPAGSQQGLGAPGHLLPGPGEGSVACGGGTAMKLIDVQPAGKRPMAWEQFARGLRIDGPVELRTVPAPPTGGTTC